MVRLNLDNADVEPVQNIVSVLLDADAFLNIDLRMADDRVEEVQQGDHRNDQAEVERDQAEDNVAVEVIMVERHLLTVLVARRVVGHHPDCANDE